MRLIILAALGSAGLLGASCAMAQEAPRVPVIPRYVPLEAGEIAASYQCFGTTVRLRLELRGEGVAVLDYVGQAGPASSSDLERWNAWLSEIDHYHHFTFRCAPGYESITVRGAGPLGSDVRLDVGVQWDEGKLRRRESVPVRP